MDATHAISILFAFLVATAEPLSPDIMVAGHVK
jgi:hypothetical protein